MTEPKTAIYDMKSIDRLGEKDYKLFVESIFGASFLREWLTGPKLSLPGSMPSHSHSNLNETKFNSQLTALIMLF